MHPRLGVFAIAAMQACIPHLESEGGATTPAEGWQRPENTWGDEADSGPPTDLMAEGFGIGEVVPDVRLVDQLGDEVALWQFYGDLIVLDVSTIWCAPCRALGEHTAETVEAFASQGFTYVTVLQQDLDGAPPDAEDLTLWADTYAIDNAPVLGDPDATPQTAGAIENNSFPALLLIDRDMRVLQRVNPADDPTLTAAISSAI